MAKMSEDERHRRQQERITAWCREVMRLIVNYAPIGTKDACVEAMRAAHGAFNAGLAQNPTSSVEVYKRRYLAAMEPVRAAYAPLAELLRAKRRRDREEIQFFSVPSRQQMANDSLDRLRASKPRTEPNKND